MQDETFWKSVLPIEPNRMGEPLAAEATVEATVAVPQPQGLPPLVEVLSTPSASSATSDTITISMPVGDAHEDDDGAAASTEGDEDGAAAGETAAERTVNAKRAWTDEEDAELLATVAKLGPQRWSLISSHLKGRVGKQCRERWFNHLCPEVKKGEWTPEEDELITIGVKELGTKWSEIVKRLPARLALPIPLALPPSLAQPLPLALALARISALPQPLTLTLTLGPHRQRDQEPLQLERAPAAPHPG